MSCDHKFVGVSLTEEAILNDSYLPTYMKDGQFRRYRIEYGFECGCPEGVVYLPSQIDSDKLEDWLNESMGS